MKSDIDIAQSASLHRIVDVAQRLGIPEDAVETYGHYKGKLSLDYLGSLSQRADGKLILVTAISPTPAGEGKTTTTVGLGDALNRVGRKAVICLREPSLGPVFGMKGGAAGGGLAQVVPMEDINLHFTGDFHAVAAANNLLAALIDNHIAHGNALDIDPRRIPWKRVMDMNDRSLRNIVIGLGGSANGFVREDGFDIVSASEVMAILCLADSYDDLKQRLGRVVIGYTLGSHRPVFASALQAQGAMAALLKDALKPNLVQTLENNPALIHGGPFANIAHGCNSAIATRAALKLADFVVTEAGFGADLGAEKFIDIKCRMAGLKPAAAVLVATVRALKYHGGMPVDALQREDTAALVRGFCNLERHLRNVTEHFGLPCVVALNRFDADTDAEIDLLKQRVESLGSRLIEANHWAQGAEGARALAHEVIRLTEQESGGHRYLYPADASLREKIVTIATRIYGAGQVNFSELACRQIDEWSPDHGHFPVCMAKTQMSFSADPSLRGAPSGHVLNVRELRLANGAGFVVALCGEMMTMPGLPATPSAGRIDVDGRGRISGLF